MSVVQVLIQSCILSRKKSTKPEDPYKSYNSLPGPKPLPLRIIGNGLILLPKNDIVQKLLDYALTSSDYSHFRHSPLQHNLWPEDLESLLMLPGGEKWKLRRKTLNRSFMYRALQLHNPCFHKHCDKMVTHLEERFKDGQEGVIADLLTQCTFGISSETFMVVDLEETEAGAGSVFSSTLNSLAKKFTADRWARPWLLVDWIWRLSSEFHETNKMRETMMKITDKVLIKCREKMKSDSVDDRDTMMEAMLRNGIDEKRIFEEVTVMLGVASDSAPLSAELALFRLALNPEHQERCLQEIDEVYADPSNSKNGILEFEGLKELKYLERCIQESIRITPITIIMRGLEAPLKINEKLTIPAGVSVMIPQYALHNLPQYYPNPNKYDPDRFLPENVKERHPYAYLPFGAGPRNCIGMKLAMVELKVIIATILRKFEVRTLDKLEDVKFVLEGNIKPTKPIRFRLTRR